MPDTLRAKVLRTVEEEPVGFEELHAQVDVDPDTLEDQLQELQATREVRYSGRSGAFHRVEAD